MRTSANTTFDVVDNDAILARGPITIDDRNAARNTGAANGITLQSFDAGDLSITSNGTITGRGQRTNGAEGGYGIRIGTGAQASGSVAIDIARGGVVTGTRSAVSVLGGGTAPVAILLNGDAARTRTAGDGAPAVIEARSGGGEPVSVTIKGNVTDQADSRGYGVSAGSTLADPAKGNITVAVDGTIRSGAGSASTARAPRASTSTAA